MKLSKQIMATLGVVCVTSCAAMAGEPADIQAYDTIRNPGSYNG